MTASDLLLLDTNVLVHLVRRNATGKAIEERFRLSSRPDRPLISVVTIGEGLTLGRQFGWGVAKLARLRELFRNLVVVDISRGGIVERYAEIADGTRRQGCVPSQNDLWIAATASVTGATLLTTDSDFEAVEPSILKHVLIDPAGT